MKVENNKHAIALKEHTSVLACPNCHTRLVLNGSVLYCEICNTAWIRDEYGVFRFLDHDMPFDTEDSGMRDLLNEMRQMDRREFQKNLKRLEQKYRVFEYDHVVNPDRGAWSVLGDFTDKIIVDLGCGFGAVSLALSEQARTIVAIDASLDRLRFLALLAGFLHVTNLVVVHADFFNLPLVRDSIDRFVMIGVLEWVGTWDDSVPPSALQQRLLNGLRAFMHGDGEMWLGVDNRLNPLYLTGRTHHGDVPFSPLLPRKYAHLVTQVLRGHDYRTFTYSPNGYRQLLISADYPVVEIFYAFPSYKIPEICVTETGVELRMALPTSKVVSWQHRVGKWLYPWLLRVGVGRQIAPALFLRGRREK